MPRPPFALFREHSVKHKLMQIGMLTAGVALVLATLAVSARHFYSISQDLVKDLEGKAKMAGSNSTAALIFNSSKDAREILTAFDASSNIVRAVIYTDEGELFAWYQREDVKEDPPPSPTLTSGHRFEINKLSLFQPVLVEGETIGMIFIQSDLKNLYGAFLGDIVISLVISVCSLLAAFLMLIKMQRAITNPVRDLAGLMKTVSQEKKYSIRAPRTDLKELEYLSEGFNDMLEQIQIRDKELESHRHYLETMVEKRTSELAETNIQLRGELIERKKVEEELRRSKDEFYNLSQEFNALLDAIPDNLTLQSPDLRILWVNSGAADRLGKSTSELLGRNCYSLWYKRRSACKPCPVSSTFSSGMPDEAVVEAADGRIWELRSVPVKDEKGCVVSVIEVGRDITDHRKLEEQLRQSQKMEAVGQLAGGVAHDFNNILTAIIGYAHLMEMKTIKNSPLRKFSTQIIESSERAADLTRALLAFSRKQILNPKPVNLKETIENAQNLLSRLLSEDIELTVTHSNEDLTLTADGNQVVQVLMNLVTNARDAMPQGGYLTIKTDLVQLGKDFITIHGYGQPGRYARITVSDTGAGMSEDVKSKIFEPFFTTKEVGKGTGLGLSTAYGIIKQHDGHINCYSETGTGTTFHVYLPLIEFEDHEITPTPLATVHGGQEIILLVEDDTPVRNLMKAILEEFGYRVIEASDGEEGIRKYTENSDQIQLVILDVIMPKKNGREVYDAIKTIDPDIKVIFTSGYTADIIHKHGILEEGFDFIFKPVSPYDLSRKIREVLDR